MKFICKPLLKMLLLTGLIGLAACGDNEPAPAKPAPSAEKKSVREPVRKTFQDVEEGSLKARLPGGNTPASVPEVKDGHRNLSVLKPDDPAAAEPVVKRSAKEKALLQSFRSKIPAGSLAEKLAPLNQGKVIRWLPQQFSELAGCVRLPATAVSPDRTMILIAETLGDFRGPFGTRLVFLDTCSWQVSAVHHLWKKDIRWIAISPDHQLLLAARGQKALKSQDELIVLDPWNGREKQVVPLPGVRKIFVHPKGRVLAVFAPDSERAQQVAVFDRLLKGDPKYREIRTENRQPQIAFSPDGRMIYLAGDRTLEAVKNSDLRPVESIPLPSGFVTADLLALPDNTVIAAPDSVLRRPAIVIRHGKTQEFGSASRGLLLNYPAEPEKFFGAVMSKQGKIAKFTLSTLEERTAILPEECRPRTAGDPLAVFAFAHHPALAVMDERGHFYLIYRDLSGKRWHKEILIRPAPAQ